MGNGEKIFVIQIKSSALTDIPCFLIHGIRQSLYTFFLLEIWELASHYFLTLTLRSHYLLSRIGMEYNSIFHPVKECLLKERRIKISGLG